MSIEKAYNSWSEQYDTNENKTRDLDKEATIRTLSSYEYENVLELGCGTGKNTAFLLKKAKSIIGLDFSQEMLNKAIKKINSEKVRFRKADLNENWNIEKNSVDLITSSLTLEHIEDLDFIFSQANEKLISKGKFFISELHPFKQYTGSKAKYTTENGVEELEVFVHHVSEYISAANKNHFKLIELNEWFDNQQEIEIPRLISFVFEKIDS